MGTGQVEVTTLFAFLRSLSNSILMRIFCLFDSHGQLGHGGLTSEQEPKAVEALWGMSMSCVATGGWHSVCISGKCYIKMLGVKRVKLLSNVEKEID